MNTGLREGFTTGSCAAAAALASCLWRRDGECPAFVEIVVPEGRTFRAAVIPHDHYECGVVKDAGDDPDITDGCEVRVTVEPHDQSGDICFKAGCGVGTITLPGLKLPVGEAAINPVPRNMISDAVRGVLGDMGATVTVSVPGGEELARRTYNPRLGVVGGISILGTTGIVRPMSEDALVETIALELSVIKASGADEVALVFGSQGETNLMKLSLGLPITQMSNFVGMALDECVRLGFKRVVIAGHPGKLAKVAAGVMNTHSRYADARREAIVTHLALIGADVDLLRLVYESVTTDGVIDAINQAGFNAVWDALAIAAKRYCLERVHNALDVAIVFMDGGGLVIGKSEKIFAKPY